MDKPEQTWLKLQDCRKGLVVYYPVVHIQTFQINEGRVLVKTRDATGVFQDATVDFLTQEEWIAECKDYFTKIHARARETR